jgi:hypothetical protein
LEELERRNLLATVFWTGGSATTDSWGDKDNWGGTRPKVGDTVVFDWTKITGKQKSSSTDLLVPSIAGLIIKPNYTGNLAVLKVVTNLSITSMFNQQGGTIELAGPVAKTGNLTLNLTQQSIWSGGKIINTDRGSVELKSGQLIVKKQTSSTTPTLGVNFTIDSGSSVIIQDKNLALINRAELDNDGTFTMKGSGSITSTDNTGVIANQSTGLFSKEGSSTVFISAKLENVGKFKMDDGSLWLAGGGDFGKAASFDVSGKLYLANGNFRADEGVKFVGNGTTYIDSTLTVSKDPWARIGQVNWVFCESLEFDKGIINGTGNIWINNFKWYGGVIEGKGWARGFNTIIGRPANDGSLAELMGVSGIPPFVVNPGASDLVGTSVFFAPTLDGRDGRSFETGKAGLTVDGEFWMVHGAQFTNEAPTTFKAGSGILGDLDSTFTNWGQVRAPGVPAKSIYIGVTYYNGYTVGTLTEVNKFRFRRYAQLELVQSGTGKGITALEGDSSASTGGFDIVGGNLEGFGTLIGDVINSGELDPGFPGSTGILNISGQNGNYAQAQSGKLSIGIGGYGAGTGFDQFNVGNVASLAGTLNINLINGFVPNVGDTFKIMTYGSYTGDFQTVTGQVFGGGAKRFDLQYNASNLTLVVDASSSGSAPTVSSLGTSSGTTAGGTSVAITGMNFTGVTGVSFGGVPANSFTVNSSTLITAYSPPDSTGTVDVTVTGYNGTSSTSSADDFTYSAAATPTVTAVSPNIGDPGGDTTYVTITGTNFLGATGVKFGTTAADWFIVNSATQITTLAPAGAAGTVDVTVTTYASTSSTGSADHFSYPGVPTVSSISPGVSNTGGGQSLTITGSGFTGAAAVLFGNYFSPSFTINSDTSITATIPPAPAGTVDVTVVGPNGTSVPVSADRFGYAAAPPPSVTSLTGTSGTTAGGMVVTINGSGFTGAQNVMFGTTAASSFTVISDTQISAVSPSQAAGTVDVTVDTFTGTSPVVSNDQFTYTAQAAPTVTAISASTGNTGGGNVITVTGTGFTGATGVSFGTVSASDFNVLSDTSLTATVPAQAAGTVDVTVTTYGGTSSTGTADHYVYTAQSAPTVTGITPSSGYTIGGDQVEITGTNFTGATGVNFGGVAATDFSVLSDTAIVATSPAATATGAVDITVTTYGGTSSTGSADRFTYNAVPAPTLTSINTSSGSTAGGTVVTLTGTGFTNATEVFFGSVASSDVAINSDTQITAVSPAQAVGTMDISVVSPGGTSAASSADRFSYTAATTPAVSSLDTSSGTTAGGGTVNITGTNFTGAFAVNFGGVPAAEFTVNSDTSITAVAPPQATGTVDITVTTYTGTSASTSSDHFTVSAASAPTVNSLGTTGGTTGGGTLVGITGLNFTGATAVNFGNVAASSFTVNSDTSITAVAPAQTAGTFHVTVQTYAGTSSTGSGDQFTYTAASAPSVTSVTPNTGTTPGGTQVSVIGSNFTGATGVNFGSVAASSFTVNSDTSITAIAPPEAAATVDITVTTYGGSSSTGSADHFIYTNVTAPAPAVTGVSPNTGATTGGQVVTITGTNFSGATAVKFGTTAATTFTINSDTQITATAPSGSAGQVDIKVTTNNGTSSAVSADHFTYKSTGVPTVTSLGTTTGTTAGGTSVIINGTNFTGATAVLFGGTPAASYTVNSSTKITATSPPLPVGTVDITVTTPSGTSATSSSDQFTYTAASLPTVTSLGTSSGSTAGGTSVVITGTNFTGATGVSFGSVAASSFTINSGTSITATSPPQWVGTLDVTVSTYSGTSATGSGDRYSYTAATTPAVSSLGTNTGTTAGGTSVNITGTNFTGATAVMFGSVAASSFTVNSATSITATSPPQATGVVDITVTTYTGTSASTSSDHFTYTAASAPTVTSLGTSSGTTGGGTSVTITGTNFTGATAVNFGSVAAASFTVNSGTSITAFSPPQAAGTVDVTVTTYSGTSSTGSGDRYTYNAASAPSVTGVTANSGLTPGGTVVTITGSSFTGASAVSFGTTAAADFTINSDGSIVATAPAGTVGTVDITVTTPTGTSSTSSADHYTYNAVTAPTVTGLNPSTGATGGGTLVTIGGSGFLNATGVNFGATAASSFIIVSDNVIVATAPPLPAGTVDVTVAAYDKVSAFTSADRFNDTASLAPAVTSVSPTSGSTAGGTSVTVTGTGFTGASGVTFGGVAAASFSVNSDTSITAITPPEAAATVDIVVSTPTGTSAVSSSDHFTFNAASSPTVTGLSLTSGSTAGGTVVTITGTNFTGASAVNFGTVAASFTVKSDTRITATAPSQAAGTIDVTVTTPSGTSSTGSADHFTYNAAALPSVTGITPTSGSTAGGTVVTVTGSGFTGATAVNFGTTAATDFTVLSDTSLTAIAPAGSAGTVDTTVVTPSGTSSTGSADQFTYNAPSAPTVTAVSPSSGGSAGGTAVAITGTGFTNASGVNFGQYAATSFTVNSDTQITAVAPAQAAATVDITVTTVAGTSSTGSADHFAYNAPSAPTVTSVNPTGGPLAGGMEVGITGTGFTGATAVTFGTTAASSFTIYSDGALVAVAPAESAGTVDITVTTYGGTSSTSAADQYTYVGDPALSATGTNISPNTGVLFNGTVATFTDGDSQGTASQFTAVISWGDGNYSLGTVAKVGSSFTVTGSNTYASQGTYTVNVQIYDVGGSTASTQSTATVTNPHGPSQAGITATGTQATATHNVAFSGAVASFTDSASSSFTVTITWGDGNSSTGTVTPNANGGFDVSGTNTYATAGTYTVSIKIVDGAGNSTTTTTTITVADTWTGEEEPLQDFAWLDDMPAFAPNNDWAGGRDDIGLTNGQGQAKSDTGRSPVLAERAHDAYDPTVISAEVEWVEPRRDTGFLTEGGPENEQADDFWAGSDATGQSLAWEDISSLPAAVLDELFANLVAIVD